MENKIIKPRCPTCGKLVANWVDGASGYTCDRCDTSFIVSNTALQGLTRFEKSANTTLN